MSRLTGEPPHRVLARMEPDWAGRAPAWRKQLSSLIEFDAAALALLKPEAPAPDMFLLLDDVPRKHLAAWCGGESAGDSLLHQAIAHQAHCVSDHAGLLPGHAVAIASLACPQQKIWWWLAFSRASKPYTPSEQYVANMLLRTLIARFDFPIEPDLGHILLNGNHQLLHVDTATSLRLLQTPALIEELTTALPPVIAQRWRDVNDYEPHSVFVALDGEPTWVRFCCGRAADVDSRYWYLQLRPLDADDPPAVGLVDDPRVGLALGYLADHYQQAPSLAEVAAHVDTSPFHFHRLFTKQAAISPKHYLLRTQLVYAKQLLRATRLPIGEVARRCGFSSHGHFTATFNRLVGKNPSEYREQA